MTTMTKRHVEAVEAAIESWPFRDDIAIALPEILDVVKGLADGSLRCADSKTQRVVELKDIEAVNRGVMFKQLSAEYAEARAILRRWLSTPEQPAPTEESK